MSMQVSRFATKGDAFGADAKSNLSTGLVTGTTVMTRDGELPVEYLGLGDQLITRDAGFAKITAVSAERREMQMVRIGAGSLGHTRPEADVLLPWGQKVLIRDWRAQTLYGVGTAMIPAHRLIDGEFITDAGMLDVTVYRLSCDAAHVMYAGGLELACCVRKPAYA